MADLSSLVARVFAPAHQKMTISIAVEFHSQLKCVISLFPALPTILKAFLPSRLKSVGSYLCITFFACGLVSLQRRAPML